MAKLLATVFYGDHVRYVTECEMTECFAQLKKWIRENSTLDAQEEEDLANCDTVEDFEYFFSDYSTMSHVEFSYR